MSENQQREGEVSNKASSPEKTVTKSFFKKSKGCPFASKKLGEIDYKNPDMLGGFVSEGGRMLPTRITNVSAGYQRKLKKAIKRCRILAMMPFVSSGR